MNDIKCPKCGSDEIQLTWVELPVLSEAQIGDCFDCMHHWVECAR